jgi:hypothetical protein
MIQNHNFPLDHFGIAANHLIQQLQNSALTRRERTRAFRSMERIAKSCKAIPSNVQVLEIGIVTDLAGGCNLLFSFETDTIKKIM